jgi:hypothetical protein
MENSPAPSREPDDKVEIDARELSGIFAVPQWLRRAGQASWLLVGLTLLLVGIIWLLALTNVIVLPLIAGVLDAPARGAPRARRCAEAHGRTA